MIEQLKIILDSENELLLASGVYHFINNYHEGLSKINEWREDFDKQLTIISVKWIANKIALSKGFKKYETR